MVRVSSWSTPSRIRSWVRSFFARTTAEKKEGDDWKASKKPRSSQLAGSFAANNARVALVPVQIYHPTRWPAQRSQLPNERFPVSRAWFLSRVLRKASSLDRSQRYVVRIDCSLRWDSLEIKIDQDSRGRLKHVVLEAVERAIEKSPVIILIAMSSEIQDFVLYFIHKVLCWADDSSRKN